MKERLEVVLEQVGWKGRVEFKGCEGECYLSGGGDIQVFYFGVYPNSKDSSLGC